MPVNFFFADERLYEFSVDSIEQSGFLVEKLREIVGEENVAVNY